MLEVDQLIEKIGRVLANGADACADRLAFVENTAIGLFQIEIDRVVLRYPNEDLDLTDD